MNEKLKAALDTAKGAVKDFWNTYRLYIIGFTGFFLFVKFRDVLIDLLVSSGKRVMDDTKKKDEQLAKEENDAKAKAAALQAQIAQEAAAPKEPVGDDWYKKKP